VKIGNRRISIGWTKSTENVYFGRKVWIASSIWS